jgi:hypothetical protein
VVLSELGAGKTLPVILKIYGGIMDGKTKLIPP